MDNLELIIEEGENLLNLGIIEEDFNSINSSILKFSYVINIDNKNIIAYSLRAKAFSNINDFEHAIKDYKKIISFDIGVDAAPIYNGIASLNIATKNYSKALSNVNKAMNLNPNDYLNYFTRGRANEELKNPLEAIMDYNKSILINENDSEIKKMSFECISNCENNILDIIFEMNTIYSKSNGVYSHDNFN